MKRPLHITEFFLLDLKQIPWMKGTYKTFGFRSTLCLMSPLANLVLNDKYRDFDLVIDPRFLQQQRTKDIKLVHNREGA